MGSDLCNLSVCVEYNPIINNTSECSMSTELSNWPLTQRYIFFTCWLKYISQSTTEAIHIPTMKFDPASQGHEIVAEDVSKSHLFCCKLYPANVNLNPLTAPVCKISRLNDTWVRLQCVYCPVIYATAFSMLWILAHASAKQKTKMFEGFKLCSFIGHFQATSWQWRG